MNICDTYYNGKFGSFAEIKIPLTDRSIFFGDGIYDAAVGRGNKIYLLEEHIRRFTENAEKMNIPFSMKTDALASLLYELAEKSGLAEYFVYFQLSRYSEERIHAYPKSDRSNLLITVKPWKAGDGQPIKLISREDIRYSMCNIKTLNLLPAVLASHAAEAADCGEAVFARDGLVTECAHSNLFMINKGVLYTHPLSRSILPGITRARLISLCEKEGIQVKELPFSLEALLHSDGALVSSTSKLVIPVSEIDGVSSFDTNNSLAVTVCDMLREDFAFLTK